MSDDFLNDRRRELRDQRDELIRDQYPRPLNREERNAIAALRRLAKRWPKTLKLFSAAGSLVVVHTYDGGFGLDEHSGEFIKHVKANIDGIPNDGGDPW